MTLEIFCNWHDITAVDHDVTLGKLKAAGATRALLMTQTAIKSDAALKVQRGAVIDFVAACRDEGIAATLCTGPTVLTHPEPLRCRDRLVALCRETHATPMLDAENDGDEHWDEAKLAPWLEVPDLAITTTRWEAQRLGRHGRWHYAQVEGQTSTETLRQAMSLHLKCTDRERIVWVTGSFDVKGDPRTLAEQRTDLERCRPQALVSGRHAVFVAQTTSQAECGLLSEWAAQTWAA